MSLPLALILKQIESAPESIIPILSALHYDKSLLNTISKPDSRHLVSRTLNLARSPNVYNKWCGTALIRVLSENYALLASDGVVMLGQLVKNLDNYNETIDSKIFTTTVETINHVCAQIRGKPTLTREILTPNLAQIISLYLEKLHLSPTLVISSLYTLVKSHPTTFRPFANKLASRLATFLDTPEFVTFPESLKNAVYNTLAVLPVVEKTDPEAKWETNVRNIVKEISSVLAIYTEFLNINEDGDLVRLLQKLPKFEASESNQRLLSTMTIDINQPQSVFQISTRIEILLNLLNAYLTTETAFSVRVPLGLVVTVAEVICSLNLKFVPFKYEIRDESWKALIRSTTVSNQWNAIRLLHELANTYKASMLPHLTNILSFLEILIPFKNKKIDYNELLINEQFSVSLLDCIERYLSLVGNLGDNSQLLRFIDIALLLVEPRVDSQFPQANGNNQASSTDKKIKKKKNNNAVALSDLLSHQHLFTENIAGSTVKSVRKFLNTIITKVNLPPTQHYKIMRYLILETVNAKYYSSENSVPAELKTLLINSVLYPGFEKISLLPVISSLLPEDPLLSVFSNPRFPPLPVYIKKTEEFDSAQGFEDEPEEEDDEEQPSPKRQKIETTSSGEQDTGATIPDQNMGEVEIEADKEHIFVAREIDPETVVEFAQEAPVQISEVTETVVETTTASEPTVTTHTETTVVTAQEQDEDSDFEIPEIELGSDDDEE